MTLAQMRARRAELLAQMRALLTGAETAGRADLDAAETVSYDAMNAEAATLATSISRHETLGNLESADATRRDAAARGQGTGNARQPGEPAAREFETLGQFIHATRFNPSDQRLLAFEDVVGDVRGEQRMDTGSTGGFMVPVQFRPEIMRVDPLSSIVRPRANVIPAGSPPDSAISLPALDQTGDNPANVFGGVEVNWVGEGGDKGDTSAGLREIILTPQEVAGTVTVTDKLLRNWQASGAFLETLLRGAVSQAEDRAFIFGDGVAKPLGYMNSGAALKVNRTTANTVVYADLVAMAAKIIMRGGSPLWNASQGVMQKLNGMVDSQQRPIFVQSPVAGTPATLLGYPIIFNNRNPGLGSMGDISISDLSYYLIKDGSGPFVAASEHVYFKSNKTVLKIFWNVDGQPWLTEPFVEENGFEVSPFVILDVPA